MNRPSKTRRMMLWRRQCLSFSASLFPAVFFLHYRSFIEINLVAYPLHLVSNIQCIQGTKSVLNAHPELTWLNILSKLYSAKARIAVCQSVNQQFLFRITAEEAASSSPEKFALSNLRSQLFEPRFLLFNLLFRLIIFA